MKLIIVQELVFLLITSHLILPMVIMITYNLSMTLKDYYFSIVIIKYKYINTWSVKNKNNTKFGIDVKYGK